MGGDVGDHRPALDRLGPLVGGLELDPAKHRVKDQLVLQQAEVIAQAAVPSAAEGHPDPGRRLGIDEPLGDEAIRRAAKPVPPP
jgi:hypothetical protein